MGTLICCTGCKAGCARRSIIKSGIKFHLSGLNEPASCVWQHPHDVLGEPWHAVQVRHHRMAQRESERRALRLLSPSACMNVPGDERQPPQRCCFCKGIELSCHVLPYVGSHVARHAVNDRWLYRACARICSKLLVTLCVTSCGKICVKMVDVECTVRRVADRGDECHRLGAVRAASPQDPVQVAAAPTAWAKQYSVGAQMLCGGHWPSSISTYPQVSSPDRDRRGKLPLSRRVPVVHMHLV